MSEVGRNELCPCGSGAKYKYCCLRKKQRGAVNDDWSDSGGWERRLAQVVNRGYEAIQRGDDHDAARLWLDGWDEVYGEIPAEGSTLSSLDRQCDGERSLISWVWKCLDVLRLVGLDDPEMARRGAEFVGQLLAGFPGEPAANKRNMRGDRGWLLAAADRWDEATKEFERLIDDVPDRAVGYVRWSDAIIEFEHEDASKAVELLERAAARPVDDGTEWSLEVRLKGARQIAGDSQETEEEAVDTTQEDNERREAFWDEFAEAELDEQFALGAEAIENASWFDNESAYYLFVEELERPSAKQHRHREWLELLDTLREHRPELAEKEGAYLGSTVVDFALYLQDRERLEEGLELLFCDPGNAVELELSVLPQLAYHGVDGVVERMRDGWEQFLDTEGLFPFVFGEWAEWGLWFLLADWADEDLECSRNLDDLREAMGGMFDELKPEWMQHLTDCVLGPEPGEVDADDVADIDDRAKRATAIGLAFGRTLIEREGWSSQKALLAARYLRAFINYCAGVDEPFGDQYTTDRAKKVKVLNRELKQLRDRWKNSAELTPHPDLAIGFAQGIHDRGMFGQAYQAAAFAEAVVRLAPWMHERGMIEDPKLVDQIQNHFRRRIEELSTSVTKFIEFDPVVDKAQAEMKQWLTAGE